MVLFKAKDQDTKTQIEEGLMRKQMTAFKTMIVYTEFWNFELENFLELIW